MGLALIDPLPGVIARSPDLLGQVVNLAGSFWLRSSHSNLQRIDPRSGKPTDHSWILPPGVGNALLLSADGSLWVLTDGALLRVDIPSAPDGAPGNAAFALYVSDLWFPPRLREATAFAQANEKGLVPMPRGHAKTTLFIHRVDAADRPDRGTPAAGCAHRGR